MCTGILINIGKNAQKKLLSLKVHSINLWGYLIKKNNSLLINLLKINMSEQQFVEATMFPNISIYNLLKCPIHPSIHPVFTGSRRGGRCALYPSCRTEMYYWKFYTKEAFLVTENSSFKKFFPGREVWETICGLGKRRICLATSIIICKYASLCPFLMSN